MRWLLVVAVFLLSSSLIANVNASATFVYDDPQGEIPGFLSGGYDIRQVIVSNCFQGTQHVLNVSIICADTIGYCGINISGQIMDYNGFLSWGSQHKDQLSNPDDPIWGTYMTYYREYFIVHAYEPQGDRIASMMTYPTPVDGHRIGEGQTPMFEVGLYVWIDWQNVIGEPKTLDKTFQVLFDISNYSAIESTISVECTWHKFGGTLKDIYHGFDQDIGYGLADEWSSSNIPIPEYEPAIVLATTLVAAFCINRILMRHRNFPKSLLPR